MFYRALLALFFLFGTSAHATRLCTMTLNSSDEKVALSQTYGPAHELVPNSKDPSWLERACLDPTPCDIVLVSGHFGGLFFGESTSPTLDLNALEDLSCNNRCPALTHAKSVYLMGCNTLATKAPDSRSIEEYVRVLVMDGFPIQLAEDVASSRYENYGLSMAERMSVSFPASSRLYGFSSKSPLGATNGPLLRQAFRNAGSTDSSRLDQALTQAFAGTQSFRIVSPSDELAQGSVNRALVCGMRSNDPSTRTRAYLSALQSAHQSNYFDRFLERANDPSLISAWNQLGSDAARNSVQTLADQIFQNSGILIGTQFKVLRLKASLGFLSEAEYVRKINELIESRLRSGMDYITLDQLCTVAKTDPTLSFRSQWMTYANVRTEGYFARLKSCFSSSDAGTHPILMEWLTQTQSSPTRRESLRALRGSIPNSEASTLLRTSSAWSMRDQTELHFSLGTQAFVRLDGWNSCSRVQGATANDRDNARWTCYNQIKNQIPNLESCQAIAAQFETESGLGIDWDCFKKFPDSLSLSACSETAHHSLKAGPRYSPEKADDFLFNCWDQLRAKQQVNRSECLGFTREMSIPGDQIKQNWNCMHQINE